MKSKLNYRICRRAEIGEDIKRGICELKFYDRGTFSETHEKNNIWRSA